MEKKASVHWCSKDDMHPYECSPMLETDKPCIHCERLKFDGHDPDKCALCNF